MTTKYFLMSGVPANSEHAQALSKEFGDGFNVTFLDKPFNMPYVVGLADGAKTVAVIDDEPSMAELFSRYLTKKGITVDMYEKGSDFLNSVQNDCKKYDIVFCDTDMPGNMSGPNVLRQYHELVTEKKG